MKILLFMSAIVPSLLLGCAHHQEPPPPVFVREVPVRVASSNSLDVIRFPSTYKAYTVGRRVDAESPNLMSEAHILYVRESEDRWNFHQPSSQERPRTKEGLKDGAFAPVPVEAELKLELEKQRRLSESLQEQTQLFQKAAETLVPTVKKAVELATQAEKRMEAMDLRLQRLEEGRHEAKFTNWPSSIKPVR